MTIMQSAPTFVPYGRLKALVTFKMKKREDGLYDVFSSEKGQCYGENVPQFINLFDGTKIETIYDVNAKAYNLKRIEDK